MEILTLFAQRNPNPWSLRFVHNRKLMSSRHDRVDKLDMEPLAQGWHLKTLGIQTLSMMVTLYWQINIMILLLYTMLRCTCQWMLQVQEVKEERWAYHLSWKEWWKEGTLRTLGSLGTLIDSWYNYVTLDAWKS